IGGEQNSPVDNSAGGGEPDPDANNAMLNGYVAPGGMGELGKFQMRDNWKPDPQFIQRAALWGITLRTDITPFELAEFITYWKAEGKAFHHDQWQQKLARSVQQSRARPVAQQQRRDINDVPEPDKAIPQGFRGYQPS
ncbi:DnaT-like ssDNA-binding domain-containing protein, partial [Enterobacter hormaechei]